VTLYTHLHCLCLTCLPPSRSAHLTSQTKSKEARPQKGKGDSSSGNDGDDDAIEPTADNFDDYCRQLVRYINGSADCELTLEVRFLRRDCPRPTLPTSLQTADF
jgi:hypothetical protein